MCASGCSLDGGLVNAPLGEGFGLALERDLTLFF